jgi:single-strand DNA-binding protein
MSTIILAAQIEATELRYTQEQTPVCVMAVSFFQSNGKDKEPTRRSLSVSAWGEMAETVSQQFPEQSYVIIQGRPSIQTVEQPDSTRRKVVSIMASHLHPGAAELRLNQVSLSGRVGAEPDIRWFESGAVVSRLSVAVNRSKQQVDWFALEGWSQTAETIAQYVHKGDPLGVEGYLKIETWEQEGEVRSKPVIGINAIQLLGSRPKEMIEEEF